MKHFAKRIISAALAAAMCAALAVSSGFSVRADGFISSNACAADIAQATRDIVIDLTNTPGITDQQLRVLDMNIGSVLTAYSNLSPEDKTSLASCYSALINSRQSITTMLSPNSSAIGKASDVRNSFRYINNQPLKVVLDDVNDEVLSAVSAASVYDESESVMGLAAPEENESTATDAIDTDPVQEPAYIPAHPIDESGEVSIIDAGDVILGTSADNHNGIDVSHYQGDIDWKALKNSGEVEFVIIRCGFAEDLTKYDDTKWERNAKACEELGIPYGVYLYSYADTAEYIPQEINHTLRLLKGHTPTLPVYYDIEERSILDKGADYVSTMALQFCKAIKNAGYEAGVYASKSVWSNQLVNFAKNKSYHHWIAQWYSECTYDSTFECWQYSSYRYYTGISGRVDADIWYGDISVDTDFDKVDKTNISYKTHIQNKGWEETWSVNGLTSGTSGQSLRLEAIKIVIANNPNLGVRYKTHVQNIGWQNWVKDGVMSGTEGKSYRLEAIQIELTGSDASKYDVYYCVHAQNYGWLGWAKNGAQSGTANQSLRLEAIRIQLLPKGSAAPKSMSSYTKAFYDKPTPSSGSSSQSSSGSSSSSSSGSSSGGSSAQTKSASLTYKSHIQNIGWQGWVKNGAQSGTTGRSLRMEALNLKIADSGYTGSILYKAHVQNIGWQGWVRDGQQAGTTGRSLRLEAMQIKLEGEIAQHYDIYYRTHVQNFGWSGWAKNGQSCGSAGYSYRLEAIEIKLVPKGGAAPGSTSKIFHQR